MKNIKVSTKLLILVIVMSLIIGIIGIYGEHNLRTVNTSVETVYQESVLPLKQLTTIAEMYTVNIVAATNKIRDENINWETGREI